MSLRWMAVALAVGTVVMAALYRRGEVRPDLSVTPAVQSDPVDSKGEGNAHRRKFVNPQRIALTDLYGKPRAWSDWADRRGVVLIFVGNECPIVQYYAGRLETLSRELAGKGLSLIAINSNAQDSLTELQQWKKKYELSFDVLKDANCQTADELGATRTPEAFLLSSAGEIIYQGRIDDQYEIGIARGAAKHAFLLEAVDQFLAGEPLTVARTTVPGCLIGRMRTTSSVSAVNFADHVAPIIETKCAPCHQPNEIGPFSLLNYEDVAHWGSMIRETVESGRMPPWPASEPIGYFAHDKRLTADEKGTLLRWIEEGCSRGRTIPPLQPLNPPSPEGWHIGKPDVEFVIGDRPFELPASGDIDYQFYTVDPKFTEDRWIQSAEFVPGNRAVVHHAAITLAYPEKMNKPEFGFFGFAPGTSPLILPPGRAVYVPAGSLLKFQIHYTPIGTPTTDRSKVGLKFIPGDPNLQLMVPFGSIADTNMVIPPGSPNVDIWTATMIDKEFELWSIFPHMHLRGKSVMIEALEPNASVRRLLTIPKWDFNWQLTYELKKPIRLHPGTLVHMRALFDNSSENPANPDPQKEVRWGRMTNDEMWVVMLNGFEVKENQPVPAKGN